MTVRIKKVMMMKHGCIAKFAQCYWALCRVPGNERKLQANTAGLLLLQRNFPSGRVASRGLEKQSHQTVTRTRYWQQQSTCVRASTYMIDQSEDRCKPSPPRRPSSLAYTPCANRIQSSIVQSNGIRQWRWTDLLHIPPSGRHISGQVQQPQKVF